MIQKNTKWKLADILASADDTWLEAIIAGLENETVLRMKQLIEVRKNAGNLEKKDMAAAIVDILSENLHQQVLTQKQLELILGKDPSKKLLYELLKSLNEREKIHVEADSASNELLKKISPAMLQSDTESEMQAEQPLNTIEDLQEVEQKIATLPKCNQLTSQLKDNIATCVADKKIYALTSNGKKPILDFLIEYVIRPIYNLVNRNNSSPGFFASKAEKSFHQFKNDILGDHLFQKSKPEESQQSPANEFLL
ncbi:MAG: hypothetical protein ACRCXC_10960 [Legionella sp.]